MKTSNKPIMCDVCWNFQYKGKMASLPKNKFNICEECCAKLADAEIVLIETEEVKK